MRQKLIGRSSTRLLIPLAMIALTGLGLSVAGAQTGTTAIEPVTNLPADLLGQVSLYGSTHRSSTPRPGTLYTFDIGGNDIMSALNKYGATAVTNGVVSAAEKHRRRDRVALRASGALRPSW